MLSELGKEKTHYHKRRGLNENVMSSCLLKEGLSDNKKWLWGSTKCVRAISHHDNSVDF